MNDSMLRDCEFLNASMNRGHPVRDIHREQRTPLVPNRRTDFHQSLKNMKRCPICGGMVIMPCLLCSLGE